MEGIFLLVSLLVRKGGFLSLSSTVEVVCPFYSEECFVLGLSFCLSRDIKSIRGACGVGEIFFLYIRGRVSTSCKLVISISGVYKSKVRPSVHSNKPDFSDVHLNPDVQGAGAGQTEQGSGELPLKEGLIKAQSRDIKEVQVRPDSLQGPNIAGLRTESVSKSLFSEGVFDISEFGNLASMEGGGNDLVHETVAMVQANVTTVMETKFCGINSSLMPTSKLVEVSNFTTTMESPKS
nr:hypothetical protein CFP56_31294 [Quercus suber]